MSAWTKLGCEWARSPSITALDGNVVMLYVSALGHCAEYITEGHVARRYIAGLWPGLLDVEQGLQALEDADLVEITDDGIYLVEWAEHLLSAEEAERRRAQGRERQKRYRAKVEASRNASRNASCDGVSNALPTPTPTPTRSGGGGVGASGVGPGGPPPTAPGDREEPLMPAGPTPEEIQDRIAAALDRIAATKESTP